MQYLPEYDIRAFHWDASENMFYAVKDDLWDINPLSNIPFPSDRKQFIIRNPMTDGYRRFRLVKEQESDNGLEYLFESEDFIRCIVLVEAYTNEVTLPESDAIPEFAWDTHPESPANPVNFSPSIEDRTDPYLVYLRFARQLEEPDYEWHVDDPQRNMTRPYTEEEFYDRIATDTKFRSMWVAPSASEGTP